MPCQDWQGTGEEETREKFPTFHGMRAREKVGCRGRARD